LQELWIDIHGSIERAYGSGNNLPAIRSAIETLRLTYQNPATMGAPSFEDEHSQAAYSVAYFPSHAFAYLHLLLRRNLGKVIFDNVSSGSRIVVLGSGVGAETLAITRWMAENSNQNFSKMSFLLADRANWRNSAFKHFDPLIDQQRKKSQLLLERVQVDLATEDGHKFIHSRVPDADIVFVPSLLTEMITEQTEVQFRENLLQALKPGSRVVLMDHRLPSFQHVSLQWSRDFKVLVHDSHEYGGVIIPPPSPWAIENLLDGTGKRSPVGSYSMSWSVLER
jgi:hypothetical protein